MALNFSYRPIFPGHLSEDNLVDPIRISNGGYLVEGIPENNVDAFGKPWHLSREVEDYGRERCDRSGSQESVSKDILDLLPSDPFGMDISSTFTAITGWLEDLEAGYGGYGSNEVGVNSGDYQLFAGLNFIWNNAMRLQAFQGNMSFNSQPNAASWRGGCSPKKGVRNVSFPVGFGSTCTMEGMNSEYSSEEKGVGDVSCPIAFGSACVMEGITSGFPLEEKGVADVSCPSGFGSACKMEDMTGGYCLEETRVADVCSMEEITRGYGGCSKEMEVVDGPCAISFEPTCSIEEINSGYGGCSERKGVSESVCSMEGISSGPLEEKGVRDLSCSVGYMEDVHITDIVQYQSEEQHVSCLESCGSVVEACLGEAPRLVLGLTIGYLGVRDLLSVESVCKYLHATIKSELYLWTRIHIDPPLNEKITDELLLQLTDRAQGELQCLSLVDCTRITDDGLKRVLESNLKLTKLSVPGCPKLTIEGIVNNLKAFKCMGAAGIKQLKIGALYGMEKYFEELKLLLGIDRNVQKNVHKPHFYHVRHHYLSFDDDDRALDIEVCPKCERLRLIYDCTAESCQRKEQTPQVCRACTLCIERCFKCGRCIIDGEYEETFCLDWLCSFCKRQEDLAKSAS